MESAAGPRDVGICRRQRFLVFAEGRGPPARRRRALRFGTAHLRTTASDFALSVDGKTLYAVAGARTIGRWDTKTGRLLGEVPLKAPPGAQCWFSPDRRFVAAIDSEGVGLYDAETGERKRTVAPQ